MKNDVRCGFDVITARDLDRLGTDGVVSRIKDRVGENNVYISVDIDVLDPAFAPGVSFLPYHLSIGEREPRELTVN